MGRLEHGGVNGLVQINAPSVPGRPLKYFIFSQMALVRDPIYSHFSKGFRGKPKMEELSSCGRNTDHLLAHSRPWHCRSLQHADQLCCESGPPRGGMKEDEWFGVLGLGLGVLG